MLETFATGRCFIRVQANPDIQIVSGVKTKRLLIAPEKVGYFISLRIEDKNDLQKRLHHRGSGPRRKEITTPARAISAPPIMAR